MKQIICLIFTILATFDVIAQGKVWSFRECVRYAKKHNISLKQLRLANKSKEITLNTSKYSYLPNLNEGFEEDLDFGRSPSSDGTIVDQSATISYAYVQTSMPIFTGLKLIRDKEMKKLDLQASIEGLYKAEEDLTIQILTYYMQILLNKELVEVAQMQVDLCKEQVKRIDKSVEAEKLSMSQLYDIKSQLANDEVSLTKAKNNLELSILSMMQLLNIQKSSEYFDIKVPESISDEEKVEYENLYDSSEDIYDYAVNNKPAIHKQEYLLESYRKSLQIARAGYVPQINLNASYYTYYYHYTGYENTPFHNQLNQNARMTISITLSVPIFNRFQVRNNVRSAQIAILNQKLAFESAKQSLYNEIRQAYANTVAANETYNSIINSTIAAKKKFQQIEMRFQTGKATSLEYNEAKTNYFQSMSEEKQAKYDMIFRGKILDFYNGQQINL